jgi:hypothetical protein
VTEDQAFDQWGRLFRVGRKLGRTIYMRTTDGPEHDIFLGIFDTPEMAKFACDALNAHTDAGAILEYPT